MKSKEIKAKINVVLGTQKLTSAMEKIAVSKMVKSRKLINDASVYIAAFEETMLHLVNYIELEAHFHQACSLPDSLGKKLIFGSAYSDINQVDKSQKFALLVISTNRGLCGGLNHNLFKLIMQHEIMKKQLISHIYVLGNKGKVFFNSLAANKDLGITVHYINIEDGVDFNQLSHKLFTDLVESFMSDQVAGLYVAYNHFVGSLLQKPIVSKLLPIYPMFDLAFHDKIKPNNDAMKSDNDKIKHNNDAMKSDNDKIKHNNDAMKSDNDKIKPNNSAIKPDKDKIKSKSSAKLQEYYSIDEPLDVLMDKISTMYIETILYKILIENNASEHAARMINMQNANENANKYVYDLRKKYNKSRQSAITQELSEIVSCHE